MKWRAVTAPRRGTDKKCKRDVLLCMQWHGVAASCGVCTRCEQRSGVAVALDGRRRASLILEISSAGRAVQLHRILRHMLRLLRLLRLLLVLWLCRGSLCGPSGVAHPGIAYAICCEHGSGSILAAGARATALPAAAVWAHALAFHGCRLVATAAVVCGGQRGRAVVSQGRAEKVHPPKCYNASTAQHSTAAAAAQQRSTHK